MNTCLCFQNISILSVLFLYPAPRYQLILNLIMAHFYFIFYQAILSQHLKSGTIVAFSLVWIVDPANAFVIWVMHTKQSIAFRFQIFINTHLGYGTKTDQLAFKGCFISSHQ